MSVYNYSVKTMDGKEISMEKFQGKVLLILNSATHFMKIKHLCSIIELYSKYKDEGFEILDFPCNQFGGQAPETNEEIHDFCVKNYGITFEQFSKIDVNGANADPLFAYLRHATGKVPGAEITWNFAKFLIGKDGLPVKQFAPPTQPKDLEQEIISELKK